MGRGGAVSKPIDIRIAAANLWSDHKGNKGAAGRALVREYGRKVAARPADFCAKWGKRFKDEGTVHDAPRSGRPSLQLPPAVAAAAAARFERGLGTGNRADGYTSVEEAVLHDPELEACLKKPLKPGQEQKFWSKRTLLKALKRHNPKLAAMKVHMQPPTSKAHQAARLGCAKTNLKQWRMDGSKGHRFRRTFWLDAKKFYGMPAKRARARVWTDKSKGAIYIEHPALLSNTCYQYYCVVNSELGAVAWKWVTPTPGVKAYKTKGQTNGKKRAAAAKGIGLRTRGGVSKKRQARAQQAKGPTQQEFTDVMAFFVAEAEKQIDAHVRAHPNSPLAAGALWSYDNPKVHDVDLSHLGIVEGVDRVPLPPASGDMHKVIEHVHGTLMNELSKWMLRNRGKKGIARNDTIRKQLPELFFKHITADSVSKDVQGLPPLWQWIVENDGKKNAPTKLR